MNIKNNKILRIIFIIFLSELKLKIMFYHTRNQSFIRSMSFLRRLTFWDPQYMNSGVKLLVKLAGDFRLVSCDKGTKLEKAKKKSRKARFHSKHKARAFLWETKRRDGNEQRNDVVIISAKRSAPRRRWKVNETVIKETTGDALRAAAATKSVALKACRSGLPAHNRRRHTNLALFLFKL